MWNFKKSIVLSISVCFIIGGLLAFCAFALPNLITWYFLAAHSMPVPAMFYKTVLTCFYICLPFAFIALISLLKILFSVNKEEIFTDSNIKGLRILSWCCFAVAFITLIGGWFYYPLWLIAAAAGFIGLILRVVKNIMYSAKKIREENDLTI